MADTQRPLLLRLPQEMHNAMCKYLPSRALGNLRRANREIHGKTQQPFVERHFTSMEITLSRKKLQHLLDVSMSLYADEVRTIVVEPRELLGYDFPVHHTDADLKMKEVQERRKFSEEGEDVSMLRDAIQRFRKLERVQVAHYEDSREFQNHRLEPTYCLVTSRLMREKTTALSHAFSVVSRALHKARSTSIKTLCAGARPHASKRSSIGHLDLGLPPPSYHQGIMGRPSIHNGLTNLEHIHLVLETTPNSWGGEQGQTLLSDFLAQAPNLKSLRLEFWGSCAEWLSTTLTTLTFPHLETLNLEAARNLTTTHLSAFIARHARTLRTLSLINLTFSSPDLLTTFPPIFQTPNLHLKTIRLQQITAQRDGLLLFDAQGVITTCEACKADLEANWRFEPGPICPHGNLEVTSGEEETGRELVARLGEPEILPWMVLRTLCF
ncbi:hypothetical protein PRZ48_010397 [Zasmidium cellare]|uniref:F-box domain-containing protein n=1 Tax=Zasmidium cellare TaxID=395010 RepID=A0ABR0E8U8_ZASCE|nr:hypothetical protein PRZ48_010397 [Zasmidium cellare]